LPGQWTPAGQLHQGDLVRKADGTTGVVQTVEVESHAQVMYNLTVATAHTFFVGEDQWLVHNACTPYQVGRYNELVSQSKPFDDLDIHHLPQGHPAAQLTPGYNYGTAPAIVLPHGEHVHIPTSKGTYYGTVQELLDKDFSDLFTYTNAPDSVQQELLDLFDTLYPGVR